MAERTTESVSAASSTSDAVDRRHLRKVITSSFLGSTVEFYDFLLYTSAAAVVFPTVFFSNLDHATATIASFATLAIGFLARPVGGLVFGSLGDRYGRKTVLVVTMLLMGVTSIGIGVLPTSAAVGGVAPLLLVVLRLVQGLAVGGEWGGATALSIEHAPAERRGMLVGLVATGAPTGSLLATGATGLAAALTGDQFLNWGWRIPFLASAVLVAIGLYMRATVRDTPNFLAAARDRQLLHAPVRYLFRHHWRPLSRVTLAILSAFTVQGVIVAYALNYAVGHGVPRGRALLLLTLSSAFSVAVQIIAGFANDRFGRRSLMLFGTAATTLLAFPMLWSLQTGSSWGVLLCFLLGHGFCQAILVASIGTFTGEMFPTRVRTTASGVGYQLAGSVGGFVPLIAASLFKATGSLMPIAGLLALVGVISTVAVLGSKETLGRLLPD